MPRMMTLREAATETGLAYSCLRRWILTGQFTYFRKAGNKYLVNMDRLMDFLDTPAVTAGGGVQRTEGKL